MKMLLISIGMGACVVTGGGAYAAQQSAMVCLDPSAAILWQTVTSANPSVELDWPEGAASVAILVDGKESSRSENAAQTSITVPLAIPVAREAERVIVLEAVYSDASGCEIRRDAAELALVLGVDGGEFTFIASEGNARWGVFPGKIAVVPIPEETVSLSVDGTPVDGLSAPGWYEWNGITSAGHSLELVQGANLFTAWVMRLKAGMRMILR
jgi:hypothetical protein